VTRRRERIRSGCPLKEFGAIECSGDPKLRTESKCLICELNRAVPVVVEGDAL
jgi:hypothetical protein